MGKYNNNLSTVLLRGRFLNLFLEFRLYSFVDRNNVNDVSMASTRKQRDGKQQRTINKAVVLLVLVLVVNT